MTKAIITFFSVVVVTIGFGEIFTHVAIRYFDIHSVENIQEYELKVNSSIDASFARIKALTLNIPAWVSNQQIQHPFMGFMPAKGNKQKSSNCGPAFPEFVCFRDTMVQINSLGLYESDFAKLNDNALRIGVTGGSVANLLVQHEKENLRSYLEKAFNKRIEIINLAIPAFKHPQQSIQIQYLLSLGYKFDGIIDLSGLNEIYLSRHYNMRFGISYSYPFSLYWFPSKISLEGVDVEQNNSESALLESELINVASYPSSEGVLPKSMLFRFIHVSLINYFETRIKNYIAALAKEGKISGVQGKQVKEKPLSGYVFATQQNEKCKDEKCTSERSLLWVNGVRDMNSVLRMRNIKFLSFLQPNHYMVDAGMINSEDKKVMSDTFGWEKSDTVAWMEMNRHIPLLEQEGLRVIELNEPFVFSDMNAGSIVDICCHLTPDGNNVLMKAIANQIAKQWTF